MKNVSYKKNWLLVDIQLHVYPTPTPLINYDPERNQLEADFIKVMLRRKTNSSTSDIYKYKIVLFEHDEPKKLLIFVWDSQKYH